MDERGTQARPPKSTPLRTRTEKKLTLPSPLSPPPLSQASSPARSSAPRAARAPRSSRASWAPPRRAPSPPRGRTSTPICKEKRAVKTRASGVVLCLSLSLHPTLPFFFTPRPRPAAPPTRRLLLRLPAARAGPPVSLKAPRTPPGRCAGAAGRAPQRPQTGAAGRTASWQRRRGSKGRPRVKGRRPRRGAQDQGGRQQQAGVGPGRTSMVRPS